MNKYTHIFFDLDNTLWDFNANSKETLHQLFEQKLAGKIDTVFEEFYANYVGINNEYWNLYRHGKMQKSELRFMRFLDTFRRFGLNDEQIAKEMGEEYIQICPFKTKTMPGCFEVLDYLREKGYRMAIITNGFDEVQQIKMENCGLNPYFEMVITSEKLGAKKPYPPIFNFAFSAMKAKAEKSLMIGDNHDSDIVGASNMGMDSVYLKLDKLPENFKGRFVIECLMDLKNLL